MNVSGEYSGGGKRSIKTLPYRRKCCSLEKWKRSSEWLKNEEERTVTSAAGGAKGQIMQSLVNHGKNYILKTKWDHFIIWFCPLGRILWLAAGWVKGTKRPQRRLGRYPGQRWEVDLCGRCLEGTGDLTSYVRFEEKESVMRPLWELDGRCWWRQQESYLREADEEYVLAIWNCRCQRNTDIAANNSHVPSWKLHWPASFTTKGSH